MNRAFLKKILLGAVVIFGISLTMSGKVLAADQQSIKSKAMFEGVYQCFNSTKAFAGQFMASNPQKFVINNGGSKSVKLPYGWTSASNNDLSCYEAMFDNTNGLIPASAQNGYNFTAVKNYFAGQSVDSNGMPSAGAGSTTTTGGLGYNSSSVTENSGVSKQIVYSISSAQCASGESSPTLNGKATVTFPAVAKTGSGLYVVGSGYDVPQPGSSGYPADISTCGGMTISIQDDSTGDEYSYNIITPDGTVYRVAYFSDSNGVRTSAPDTISIRNGSSNVTLTASVAERNVGSNIATDYKLVWGGGDAMTLLRGLNTNNKIGYKLAAISAGMGYSNLMLSKQEVFDLYTYYIESVFKAKIVAEGSNNYEGTDVKLCSTKQYKVNKTGEQFPSGVYGVDSGYHFTAEVSLDNVISTLNALGPFEDINNGGKCEESREPDPNDGGGGSTGTTNEGCDSLVDQYTEGNGIGAAQWLLCPAMDNSVYTADWVDTITQDMLEVKADTYKGLDSYWGTVRNIANIVMIAFLLIVIFSQITGYGIDNYGIKKMLPRLIVMAIIVNLSLYICQVAVDLSNIFGEGLRNLFGGLAGPPSGGANYVTGAITGIFAAAAGGGGAAVSAAGTALALGAGGWVAVVIAVIVLALVIVVAVIVLWFMVGARQIIIIFCIVISPLAFAAFILPNTQSMFKKWWELFKAALIVFPLCGMVSGVSAMIRTMVKNGNLDLGVAGGLITMVLPFLVFFLLPSLLKSVIAGLGKIGGALTTMGSNIMNGGRTLGQGALRLGQNTETFKNMQSEAARQRQQRNAQRVVDNVNRREASGRTLSDKQKMRRLNAQQTLNRMKQEQYMADLGAPVLSDDAAYSRAEAARETQEIKNYMDQYTGLTRPEMENELNNAVVAYNGDRSVDNATRLQAALLYADKEGMNKEMLFGKTSELNLNAADHNDAKILKRLSGSNDVVLSQYGKAMGKNVGTTMNLNDFAKAPSNTDTKLSLTDALNGKGAAALVGSNDDTLQYIAEHGNSAASTEMLINAANSTTATKELNQINSMLGNRSDLTFSADQLAGMKISSLNAIRGKVEIKGSPAHQEFVKATNAIAEDPRLLSSLRTEQKEFFNQVRGDNKFDTGKGTGSRFTVGFN